MKNITTIILAAGKSSRFKSNKSKIFHKIADRPVIEYVISIAKKISKKKIVIVCNKYNSDYFKESYKNIKLSLQKNLNGTAGAILSAKKYIPKNNAVLILFGDVPLIKMSSIRQLINKYKLSKSNASMIAFNTKNPFGYGRVEINKDKVIRVIEELHANKNIKKISLCNSGIMICNYNFLFSNIIKISNKNIKKEKYLTDLFEIAYNNKKGFNFSVCKEDELHGINTRYDLAKVDLIAQSEIKKKLMLSGVTILQPNTVRVSHDTKIGKDTIIEPFVVIKKGVVIGENVIIKNHCVLESVKIGKGTSIGPFARIRPESKVGEKVKIGNFVEIKNSIIGNLTSISHLSYIGDSKIGKKVNVGAGTITCNYDGKIKNKTLIKDNVFIGSNTSLIAPIIINQNSKIGAGSVITENIPSNSLAIERSTLQIKKKHNKTRKNKT